MSFNESDKLKILKLKSSIASYYNLQMKKIGDRQLEAMFFENCVISGGITASAFHETAIADIDVYARSAKAVTLIKDYIINSKKNIKTFEKYMVDPDTGVKTTITGSEPAITVNAVTLTNDVQFIYMDTWDNCKKRFDFIHCQPHYDLATQKLYISQAQYDSIRTRQLVETGLTTVSEKRVQKYLKRGWSLQQPFNPVQYKWSDSPTTVGIIAQDIGQLVPGTMYINTPT